MTLGETSCLTLGDTREFVFLETRPPGSSLATVYRRKYTPGKMK